MNDNESIAHLQTYLLFKSCNLTEERKKLCFLSNDILTIRENEDADPDHVIMLSSIEDIIDTSDGTSFSFALRISNNILSFSANDHIIVQKWLIALRIVYSPNELNDFKVKKHIGLKDFDLLTVIGRGFSGEVLLARYKANGKLVALKSRPKEGILGNCSSSNVSNDSCESNESENSDHNGNGRNNNNSNSNSINRNLKYAFAERNILMQSATPFITRLLSTFQSMDSLFYVLEFVPGGDLGYHLSHGKTFSPYQVKIYLAEIAMALSHLHKLGIVFRDLKPANILVDATGHLKLTDFGLSKYLLLENSTTSLCGTHEYLAPEMIKGASYSFAVDWWSYGIVAYQLLEGVLPFESQNLTRLYERISKSPLRIWKPIPPESKSFINGLLQKDPLKRLGCGPKGEEEIFGHPYFQNINWEKIKEKCYEMEFIPDVSREHLMRNFDCAKNLNLLNDELNDTMNTMFNSCSYDDSHIPGFSYMGQGLESPNSDMYNNLI
ncbi:Protein kinase 2 [Tritrichomonas foetus]|uniref:Protein kinase 2 n=1 Tax=Tritrichomonas foetus TaxID=1144522 RepID=A0A1J4K359_9EUKA|nr:Protein kinase 2 [Tritrichomonas foetus]|eukprot:OHT04188.1 Protein kinase 2 [Tritrichomonas foetus]